MTEEMNIIALYVSWRGPYTILKLIPLRDLDACFMAWRPRTLKEAVRSWLKFSKQEVKLQPKVTGILNFWAFPGTFCPNTAFFLTVTVKHCHRHNKILYLILCWNFWPFMVRYGCQYKRLMWQHPIGSNYLKLTYIHRNGSLAPPQWAPLNRSAMNCPLLHVHCGSNDSMGWLIALWALNSTILPADALIASTSSQQLPRLKLFIKGC